MAKKKNNNLGYIIGGVVIAVLVLWIIFANVGNNEVICNSPYIKVGSSCCLDQNNNNICDNDENSNIQEEQLPKYSDCDKYLSKSEKASCKYDVAEVIGDMRYCITDYKTDYDTEISENIDNCLDNVLFNRQRYDNEISISACEYYQISYRGEECKVEIISGGNDPSLCETLSGDYVDECYSDIARYTLKDKSVCEKIKDDELRYECIDYITRFSWELILKFFF